MIKEMLERLWIKYRVHGFIDREEIDEIIKAYKEEKGDHTPF